jgi:hypothetical protein
MKPLAALIIIAVVLGGLSALLVPAAQGSRAEVAARTPLERSVLHDQAAAGAIARPAFEITRVRCMPAKGFCNVRRETNAPRLSRTEVGRFEIVYEAKTGAWRYAALDEEAAGSLAEARERQRLLWAISATWRP